MFRGLGQCHLEVAYQNALAIELQDIAHMGVVRTEVPRLVYYKKKVVALYRFDIKWGDCVIEVKVSKNNLPSPMPFVGQITRYLSVCSPTEFLILVVFARKGVRSYIYYPPNYRSEV